MLINESLRRQIGREAVRFCRRCPAIEERAQDEQVTYVCRASACRLWQFLSLLGLRPGMDFNVPTAEEAIAQEHAREVRQFRGWLPYPGSDHNWEADARFHGLVPQARSGERDATFHQGEKRWRF